jgi:hypothetical protein
MCTRNSISSSLTFPAEKSKKPFVSTVRSGGLLSDYIHEGRLHLEPSKCKCSCHQPKQTDVFAEIEKLQTQVINQDDLIEETRKQVSFFHCLFVEQVSFVCFGHLGLGPGIHSFRQSCAQFLAPASDLAFADKAERKGEVIGLILAFS